MTLESGKQQEIIRFLKATQGGPCSEVELKCRRLRGGLDSIGVVHVRAHIGRASERRQARSFIIKQVAAEESREAKIYSEVLSKVPANLAPSLLWIHEDGREHLLFLEAVRPANSWPWRDTRHTSQVLEVLARLHQERVQAEPPAWDYEQALLRQGRKLIGLLESTRPASDLSFARKSLRNVRRLVDALPSLRRQILENGPVKAAFIHGDVHPGNVMLRKKGSRLEPVFLDWARSRVGSPLEDVSSWLQSLGYWEPEARRRHDTLLGAYLSAHGQSHGISRDVRDAYWLAAASNLLAGAAVYHYVIANDVEGGSPKRREQACHALRDCLRVFRRADSCWSTSS